MFLFSGCSKLNYDNRDTDGGEDGWRTGKKGFDFGGG